MNEGIKIPSVTITLPGKRSRERGAWSMEYRILTPCSRLPATLARTQPIGNGERQLFELRREVYAHEADSFRQ